MANKIVLKKSSVASKVPTVADIDYGELAINYQDEKLYFKNASNVVKSFNVTPASLTIGTGLSGTSYNGSSAVTIAIDSTVATLTGTQTLTNKSLTTPTLTGQVSLNSGNISTPALQINGYAARGGVGYHDFLSVTNTYGSATNASKYFRLNSTGDLQIINNAYTANILNLSDAGVLTVISLNANGTGVGTQGQVLQSTGTSIQWATISGTGTVTSIATGSGLTGGTITSAGTISLASAYGDTVNPYASKTAGYVLAAPSGSAGLPTFRALVAADIPTLNQNTSGNAATATTLQTARTINGVSFDGSSNITVTTAGVGISVSGTTVSIDPTVATLTGPQTLTNKSLTSFDQKSGSTLIANQNVIQTTVATTAQSAIDTFATATYRSAKYIVQITQGPNYQVSEIMVIHDGTNTTMTEYGMMNTGISLGTFTTDISSGNVRLLITMAASTSATINITRTTIVV